MFKKLKQMIADAKELKEALCECEKRNKALQKQGKDLLAKISAAEKRGGVLLLSDLNEDLITKLQSLTDDNVVVVFLEKDGTRIEIRKESTNYKRNEGFIR